MWNFLAREAAKKIGGTIVANKIAGVDELNGPEAYADRIKRDFHLRDYADAWALYDSDRAYWEKYYRPQPDGPANNELVRNSAAAAGVTGRNNVFEYGFPESNSVRPSMGETPAARKPNGPAWNNAFVRDSAAAAGVPSRKNVFEYGFPEPGPLPTSVGEAPPVRKLSSWRVRPDGSLRPQSVGSEMMWPNSVPSRNNAFEYGFPESGSAPPAASEMKGDRGIPTAFDTGASPVPFGAVPQNAPRGLPGLLFGDGVSGPTGSTAQRAGGLLGLIQDHLRNNSMFYR